MNPQIDFRYVFTADGRSAQTDTASCGESSVMCRWIRRRLWNGSTVTYGEQSAAIRPEGIDADESRRAGPCDKLKEVTPE